MTRFCLIGPTYPYRGGIAHYTTLLTTHLQPKHQTLLISFSRQYPAWLFPGKSDQDPSERPLQTDAEYLLDPMNPFTWWRTWQRIRAWEPDVVVIPWWHPFFAPAWATLGRGVKRLAKRPKLLFICHNVLPHEAGVMDKTAVRLALSPGDGFITHAQSDAKILRHILPQSKISVSPIPTHSALSPTTPIELPISLPHNTPLLLFCGFVRAYKGLDVLLAALPLVKKRVHLFVAGEFWHDKNRYLKQIEDLHLQQTVTLLDGYLPNETLVAYLRRADVVVLPYRAATQSGMIQAAFGQGCPVITTEVGGLAEVVTNGRTGLVVPPENPPALAAAIDDFFHQELGPLFRQHIETENGRFSWEHLIQIIETFTNG